MLLQVKRNQLVIREPGSRQHPTHQIDPKLLAQPAGMDHRPNAAPDPQASGCKNFITTINTAVIAAEIASVAKATRYSPRWARMSASTSGPISAPA